MVDTFWAFGTAMLPLLGFDPTGTWDVPLPGPGVLAAALVAGGAGVYVASAAVSVRLDARRVR